MRPCDTCKKVKDPEECLLYGRCKPWKDWIREEWFSAISINPCGEGVKRMIEKNAKQSKRGVKWSVIEDFVIKQNVETKSAEEIANSLGRTPLAVARRISELKLVDKSWKGCDNDCENCKYDDCKKPYAET